MNSFTVLFATIFLFALVATSPGKTGDCRNDYDQCSNDSQCCGRCCVQNKCETFYPDKCDQAKKVCEKEESTCPPEQVCYPQVVQCFAPPCYPLFRCLTPTQ